MNKKSSNEKCCEGVQNQSEGSEASSVLVPEKFKPIFDEAQKVVSSYFSGQHNDPSRGTIEIAGERYLLIRASALSINFLQSISQLYADKGEEEALSIGKKFLFDISHLIGMNDAKAFHQKMSLQDPISKLSAGPIHFAYTGWALVDILEESKPSPDENFFLKYHHPYSFESDSWLAAQHKSHLPVCIMNSGYSSGWCEQSFGIELTSVEIACRAKGDDNCTFIMAPPNKIDRYLHDHFAELSASDNQNIKYDIPIFFEQKKAQEALQASEKKYHSLYNAMSEGFALHEIIYNHEGQAIDYRILDCNPAYQNMVQECENEILNSLASDLFKTKNPPHLEVYAMVAATEQSTTFETHFAETDKDFHVSVFSPAPGKFATIFSDITQKKQLEEKIKQSEKMSAIGQLAGGIAHDFNNQLVGIMGYADLLNQQLQDSKLKQHAEVILKGCERVSELNRQLLAFARKGQYQYGVFSIHQIIKESVSLLKHSISKDIKFNIQLDSVQSNVNGDASQLQSAFVNLIINAKDAMPAGGVLSIASQRVQLSEEDCAALTHKVVPGSYIALSFADTGIGMDSETAKHIFEPFFTTKETGKGTGLGLAAVHGTVTSHQGAIEVNSISKIGTTFTIYLPLVKDDDSKQSESETELKEERKYRVLVVDDELINLEVIECMLDVMGHSYETFTSGVEAIKAFKEKSEHYDIILLDMNMPQISGKECFEAFRQINSKVRIVISSGFTSQHISQQILQEDHVKFLQKPYRMTDMTNVFNELFNDD